MDRFLYNKRIRQTLMMKLFKKVVNSLQPINIILKSFIIDVWQVRRYVSGYYLWDPPILSTCDKLKVTILLFVGWQSRLKRGYKSKCKLKWQVLNEGKYKTFTTTTVRLRSCWPFSIHSSYEITETWYKRVWLCGVNL